MWRRVCFFRTTSLMSKPGSTSEEELPLCKGARCRLDAAGYVMTCFLWRYRGVKAHASVPIFAVSEHSKCLTGCLPHLQIRLTRLDDSGKENLTIWSSTTLVDSVYLTFGPSSTVSRTLPYKQIYVWSSCPHLQQRHIMIAARASMSDKKSRDIGSSQLCERGKQQVVQRDVQQGIQQWTEGY